MKSAVQTSEDRDTDLYLVGSSLSDVREVLSQTIAANPLEDVRFDSDELRRIAREYDQDRCESILRTTGLTTEMIVNQHAILSVLKNHPKLWDHPLVVLAPHSMHALYRTEGIQRQVDTLVEPETISWGGPVAPLQIADAVYYDFGGGPARGNRAGLATVGKSLRQALSEAKGALEESGDNGIVLMDEYADEGCSRLVEVASLLDLPVDAYVVAYAARAEYAAPGKRALAPGPDTGDPATASVPIYSFVFRFDFPGDQDLSAGRRGERQADISYLSSGGHPLLEGYLPGSRGLAAHVRTGEVLREASTFLAGVLQPGKSQFSDQDFRPLEGIGIKINDIDRLIAFFENTARTGALFSVDHLHKLLRKRGAGPILSIESSPFFDPEQLETRRPPMWWPGAPKELHFSNWLASLSKGVSPEERFNRWGRFSIELLTDTRSLLSKIEESTGTVVPASVLGFYGVPTIMRYFDPETIRADRAIDCIDQLLQQADGIRKFATAGGSTLLSSDRTKNHWTTNTQPMHRRNRPASEVKHELRPQQWWNARTIAR